MDSRIPGLVLSVYTAVAYVPLVVRVRSASGWVNFVRATTVGEAATVREMEIPSHLRYSADHEWVARNDGQVSVSPITRRCFGRRGVR